MQMSIVTCAISLASLLVLEPHGPDEAAAMLSRLRAEAPEAWKQIRERIDGVEFSATVRTLKSHPVAQVTDVSFDIVVNYETRCYKIVRHHENPLKTTTRVRNPDYEFTVTPGSAGTYLLADARKDEKDFPMQTLLDAYPAIFEGGWAVAGLLGESLLTDDFSVHENRIVDVGGMPVLRVCFHYHGHDENIKFRFNGHSLTVDFLPERNWLIDRAVYRNLSTGEVRTSHSSEFTEVDGLTIVSEGHYDQGDPPVSISHFVVDLDSFQPNEAGPAAFRLPAYGISEEAIGFKPPPTNWGRWGIGVLGALICVYGLRWMKK